MGAVSHTKELVVSHEEENYIRAYFDKAEWRGTPLNQVAL
jgi:hypothetical protein